MLAFMIVTFGENGDKVEALCDNASSPKNSPLNEDAAFGSLIVQNCS